MKLPLAYLDVAAIEEIPVDTWQELFEEVGWPTSLKDQPLSHDKIRVSFAQDDPTDELLLALEVVHDLGTGAGREALLEAMQERQVNQGLIPQDCGERELALRLYLLRKGEPAVADGFVRAQIKVQVAAKHKATHEFWGAEARIVSGVEQSKLRLAKLMRAHCKEHDLGEHVEVQSFDDDGTCVFQVIHSDRTKRPLAIVGSSAARSMIQYRPVHCDVVRYEAATGRLQVAARRATMVIAYARLVGDALFSEPTFFGGEAACTLRPLQEQGRAALEKHEVPGVGRVRMTECTWRRGDRRVHQLRSPDCFEDIETLELPVATEGEFVEVKLKVQVAERGSRDATVTVRLPGKITVTPSRREALAHRYLEEIGVRCHSGSPAALDLWSLHPWRHPAAAWRATLGNRVDELAQARALFPVTLDSTKHPDASGASLEVHPVGDGEYYGVASGNEYSSKSLSATDVEGLELDLAAFGVFLGKQLALPEGQVLPIEASALDLGSVSLGEYRFRPFYLMRSPSASLVVRLRASAADGRVVLLVPRGRLAEIESNLPTVELFAPILSRRALERALVNACELRGHVPAIHYVPDGTRLVVDTHHGAIWVDDVKVDGLVPETHPFMFVEMLARASSTVIPSAELTEKLSPYRDDGTSTARKAKSQAKRAIVAALACAGRELKDDPFPSVSGGYKCALPAYVV